MKSLLQSLFGKTRPVPPPEVTTEVTASPAPVAPVEAAIVTAQAPIDVVQPVLAKVVPLAPPPVVEPVELGPELALITRGARLYGTCPHCEAQFSVRERMLRLRLTPESRALTCPGCTKPVSLPERMDRRKLS